MPVPVYGGRRPTGQVEPLPDLTGVTELRVHGVGGTTPGALLGDLAPQQVAGDGVAGFYRTSDVAGRHVEAYSWGGLTSRSGTRVLWLLPLRFLLANLAGWMCSPRARRSGLHRWFVRLGALGVTLTVGRVGGRPLRLGTVQRRRTRSRCQRSTVSGVANSRGQRLRGTRRLSAACKARSAQDGRGRATCRRKTASW